MDIAKELKILKWKLFILFLFVIAVFIALCIITVLQTLKPKENESRCIINQDIGLENSKFVLDAKNILPMGIVPETAYSDGGQSMEWIDTGFETTGKPLEVYAYGEWFPWGKDITFKQEYSHYKYETNFDENIKSVQNNVAKLVTDYDYLECPLNTDMDTTGNETDQTKILNSLNHLNRYSSSATANTGFPDETKDSADCIKNFNCNPSKIEAINPCKLSLGKGIYLKFNEDSNYAYHIINHLIPAVVKVSTEDPITKIKSDKYSYVLDKENNLTTTQVPFALPTKLYNPTFAESDIKDLKDNDFKFIPVNQYSGTIDYIFTILGPANSCSMGSSTIQYNGKDALIVEEKIGNSCYKVLRQKITKGTAPTCLIDNSIKGFQHPNELCAPLKGQRIFVKAADTDYEDNEGEVVLMFTSGVKNMNPKTKISGGISGLFIMNFLRTIIIPLWGPQEEKDIEEKTEILYDNTNEKLIIKIKNDLTNQDLKLMTTIRNGNYFIKLASDAAQGIEIKIIDPNNSDNIIKSFNYFNITSDDSNKSLNFSFKSNYQSSFKIENIETNYISESFSNILKPNTDPNNAGLFIKIRNGILANNFFQSFRMFAVVWFIFNFGIGILRQTKTIDFKGLKDDWMRFMILLWATDTENYTLMDDLLIPFAFSGIFQLTGIFLAGANSVMGSSINIDNPFAFFDGLISMMFSKITLIKISAIATSGKFYMFFIIFPLLFFGCIRMAKGIISNIFFLILSVISLGTMISIFPIYAVLSMTEEKKSLFKSWLDKMKAEFLNLVGTIGFFSLFMGFAFYFYNKALNYKVCWELFFEIPWYMSILWAILKILGISTEWYIWEVKNNPETTIILFNSFIFWMISFGIDKMNVLSSQLSTTLFGPSGGIGFSMDSARSIYQSTVGKAEALLSSAIKAFITRPKKPDKKNIEIPRLPNPKPLPPNQNPPIRHPLPNPILGPGNPGNLSPNPKPLDLASPQPKIPSPNPNQNPNPIFKPGNPIFPQQPLSQKTKNKLDKNLQDLMKKNQGKPVSAEDFFKNLPKSQQEKFLNSLSKDQRKIFENPEKLTNSYISSSGQNDPNPFKITTDISKSLSKNLNALDLAAPKTLSKFQPQISRAGTGQDNSQIISQKTTPIDDNFKEQKKPHPTTNLQQAINPKNSDLNALDLAAPKSNQASPKIQRGKVNNPQTQSQIQRSGMDSKNSDLNALDLAAPKSNQIPSQTLSKFQPQISRAGTGQDNSQIISQKTTPIDDNFKEQKKQLQQNRQKIGDQENKKKQLQTYKVLSKQPKGSKDDWD